MTRPAIQLYSLRDFDESLPSILDRVGRAGYEGVEFANQVLEADARAVADALSRNDLTPVSAHVSLGHLERDFDDLLRRYDRVGCHDLVVPHLSASHFRTAARVDAVAARLLEMERRLDEYGYRLHYHNQAHDFLPLCDHGVLGRLLTAVHPGGSAADSSSVGGRLRSSVGTVDDAIYQRLYQRRASPSGVEDTAYHRLATATAPAVGLQMDAGSVAAAGYDSAALIETFASRCRSVHLKDVAVSNPRPWARVRSVEAGEGILDVQSVLGAAETVDVDWVVYENDDPRNPRVTLANGMEVMEWAARETSDREHTPGPEN